MYHQLVKHNVLLDVIHLVIHLVVLLVLTMVRVLVLVIRDVQMDVELKHLALVKLQDLILQLLNQQTIRLMTILVFGHILLQLLKKQNVILEIGLKVL